jgi:protein-tyrosine kinase
MSVAESKSRDDQMLTMAANPRPLAKLDRFPTSLTALQAEAIGELRTHVLVQHFERGRRALAICAATEDVGCSFIASNLAIALSQVGLNTLLIDADLRNPSVGKYIPVRAAEVGLGQYLSAPEGNLGQFIQHDVLPNLSVMYSGGTSANPQELLAGTEFRHLMEQCLRDFEVTIIDTPPGNSCADLRRVSSVAGYSLIVAKQDKSRMNDIKTLIDQLQGDGVSVVGTVLSEP